MGGAHLILNYVVILVVSDTWLSIFGKICDLCDCMTKGSHI